MSLKDRTTVKAIYNLLTHCPKNPEFESGSLQKGKDVITEQVPVK